MDTSFTIPGAAAISGSALSKTGGNGAPEDGNVLPPPAVSAVSRPRSTDAPDGDVLSRVASALLGDSGPSQAMERSEQMLAKLNELLRDRERDLEFSVDEATGKTILKVIHAESGEVIRQIPPEELLHIARVFIEGTGSLIEAEA